jgi:hypothetical protein
MGIVARRAWKVVGWWGAVSAVLVVVAVGGALAHGQVLDSSMDHIIIYFGVGVIALIATVRGYQKSAKTASYDELSSSLLASTEEFCLILRPFGGDGKIILRK